MFKWLHLQIISCDSRDKDLRGQHTECIHTHRVIINDLSLLKIYSKQNTLNTLMKFVEYKL